MSNMSNSLRKFATAATLALAAAVPLSSSAAVLKSDNVVVAPSNTADTGAEALAASSAATSGFNGAASSGVPAASKFDDLAVVPTGGVNNAKFARVLVVINPPTNVPEPATLGLMGLGMLGFVASRRKSKRSNNA